MIVHGSASTYSNHRCRCDECRRAWMDYIRRRREERFALRVPIDGRLVAPLSAERHGTANVYRNWGCRCAQCTAASASTRLRQLHAQRERS